MPGKRQKGGAFERDICRTLTAWWTGDPAADVVFWRTSQSGGRATARRKKDKRTTAAHHGDLAALTADAARLTALVTFELKRGYPKAHPGDVLDRPRAVGPGDLDGFFVQAETAARDAGTPYWAVIHQRDRRAAVIYFPVALFAAFRASNRVLFETPPLPAVRLFVGRPTPGHHLAVMGCRFDAFLAEVSRTDILALPVTEDGPCPKPTTSSTRGGPPRPATRTKPRSGSPTGPTPTT